VLDAGVSPCLRGRGKHPLRFEKHRFDAPKGAILNEKIETAIAVLLSLIRKGHALVLTLSGGKDSTTTTLLGLEAIRRARAAGERQPNHYITSANTTIENPAMDNHLAMIHAEIESFCNDHELPVDIKLAEPSLASQFVVTTIGRGTLLRTPENGVKDGKQTRACSDDWKVKPQTRLSKQLRDEVMSEGFLEPVTVIGTRFAESSARLSAMSKRGESALETVRNAAGSLTISPIADWSTDDVWEFLGMFNNGGHAPFPSFTTQTRSSKAPAGRSITRMTDLYRDASEGVCGVVQGETGQRKSCGSRFGCSFCGISGERDRSMESMIQDPKHKHLKGLNDFRNYMLRTQWDMSTRELVGRSLSAAGYLKVKPDVYSLRHRMRLLGMLLTLDALEIERAEQHQADLANGRIPPSPENDELAEIQFTLVTPQQLVAIDFQLSMHHYAPHAFPAVTVWNEVHNLGRRYRIPEVETFPKVEVKSHGWFPVGAFDAEVPTDGLRSYDAEMWNPYRHPDRPATHKFTSSGERVVWYDEADSLQVDAVDANLFVTCSFDLRFAMEAQQKPGIESARFWLNEGIVKLAKGTAYKYQEMARRGQYFAHLADRLNLTPAEMDAYLIAHAISDAEHEALLRVSAPEPAQQSLFEMAA
jgi:3'-phosphoadenosine 5'-phosphosulfate sulfotransferase (PAPS reductase)/FAD synthetase